MADPKIAFSLLMLDEDSHSHPGIITPEPDGARARLGVNSLAHPEMPAEFWTGDYATALPIAERVFEHSYWDVMRLDSIRSQDVANKMANIGYNTGCGPLVQIVQRFLALAADGVVGPKTVDAINCHDSGEVIQAIRDGAAQHYRDIVARHPDRAVYLPNWLARAAK